VGSESHVNVERAAFGQWVILDLEGGQFCPQPAFSRLWPPKRRLRPRLAALQIQTDPLPNSVPKNVPVASCGKRFDSRGSQFVEPLRFRVVPDNFVRLCACSGRSDEWNGPSRSVASTRSIDSWIP